MGQKEAEARLNAAVVSGEERLRAISMSLEKSLSSTLEHQARNGEDLLRAALAEESVARIEIQHRLEEEIRGRQRAESVAAELSAEQRRRRQHERNTSTDEDEQEENPKPHRLQQQQQEESKRLGFLRTLLRLWSI